MQTKSSGFIDAQINQFNQFLKPVWQHKTNTGW